jgi:hypothetical protein
VWLSLGVDVSTLDISVSIQQHGSWLGQELVALVNDALLEFEEERFAHAALRAGVFLEGWLKLVLRTWGQPEPPRATFGELIGVVRRSEKAPPAILERLQEANGIRNRAAHDRSSIYERVSEGDALVILHVLGLVVTWFAETTPSLRTESTGAVLVPVFLSVGRAHRVDQARFVELVRTVMRDLGVDLMSVVSAYSKDRPFAQVCELMARCRGALVIGLERAHVYAISERDRRVNRDRFIPTAWNQIEGSIAAALSLPILILRDDRLHREGIFEAENHGHRIRDFDLSRECRGLSRELRGLLEEWVDHVLHPPANVRSAAETGTDR